MADTYIRREAPDDAAGIRDVNIAAFRDHPVSRHTEHLIVEALREARALEISLVAIKDGQVVGHIAFSNAGVGDSETGWFLLGPIAVLPGIHGQGIGSALMESGLDELRLRGASGCVLVGDPGFYGRFGFTTFPDLSYEGVPHDYVLGLPLAGSPPRGDIRAHEAFGIEPEQERADSVSS
jgi:putative acetyltransferase